MAEKTYRIRDIGYDAKDHSADWYNCRASNLTEAVNILLDSKGLVVESHPPSSLYSVYRKVPGEPDSWSKVTTIQVDSVKQEG